MKNYFKHNSALVESESVGANSRFGLLCIYFLGHGSGQECNICDHVFIENDVVVGDR